MSPFGICDCACGFIFTQDIYKQLNSCIMTLERIILEWILDKLGVRLWIIVDFIKDRIFLNWLSNLASQGFPFI
jgi:hypothetical protein